MRKSIALLALLAAVPALAQPWTVPPPPSGPSPAEDGGPMISSGGYVGLRGSMAFNGNRDTTWAPTAVPTAIRASYATGGGGSVYLGVYLPLNLRAELEALYRWQPLSTLSLGGVATPASGNTRIAAPFLNLFWDVPMPDDIGLQPFVGMGVGAAYVDTSLGDAANTYLRQNRWDLAYSFMAGLAMPLDETSRLTAMYRWMQVRDGGHRCATGGTVLSACLDNNIDSQSVDLGYQIDL